MLSTLSEHWTIAVRASRLADRNDRLAPQHEVDCCAVHKSPHPEVLARKREPRRTYGGIASTLSREAAPVLTGKAKVNQAADLVSASHTSSTTRSTRAR